MSLPSSSTLLVENGRVPHVSFLHVGSLAPHRNSSKLQSTFQHRTGSIGCVSATATLEQSSAGEIMRIKHVLIAAMVCISGDASASAQSVPPPPPSTATSSSTQSPVRVTTRAVQVSVTV